MEQNKFNKLLYYFPYNLTFYGGGDIWTWTYCGHNRDGSIGLSNSMWDITVLNGEIGLEYAPILVPFERLADYEVEVDGNNVYFIDIVSSYDNCLHRNNIDTLKLLVTKGQISFNIMELFFKYHVDVFGLIDLGIAEDYFKFKN